MKSTGKYVKFFKDLGRNDAAIAGGKGASLGEMTDAKISVPPGFVILSSGFEYFLTENDLVQEIEATLKKTNHREMESVERASEEIKELIMQGSIPKLLEKEIKEGFKDLDAKLVAVRSSATAEDGADHAWAGQLDTFLNTTSKDLENNVKKCFASLFTPRAIFYRFEKGLHKSHISVAVVVQKMVQSEKSGIAFSVHPVTEDRNQMIIEASWGLGEAIVSGQVTPDSYVVEKDSKNIIDVNVSEKLRGIFKKSTGGNVWRNISSKKANLQCLSRKEILELGNLIMKIEEHYGFPCDIEWAFEKEKFYITQSRPITTLSKKDVQKEPKLSENFSFDIDDYQRLFAFYGYVPFIFSYLFAKNYLSFGAIVFSDENEWLSFISKKNLEGSLRKGIEIYGSRAGYLSFKDDLYSTINEIKNVTREILTSKFSKGKIADYLKIIDRFRDLYRKTEFFFTDRIFEHRESYPDFQDNMKTFEKLKLDGRAFLNKLFYSKSPLFVSAISAIAKKVKINKETLLCYTSEELLLAFDGKIVERDFIENRQKGYLFYVVNNEIRIAEGKDAIEHIEGIRKYINTRHILKGRIASKGKITAKAYVIKVSLKSYHSMSSVIKNMKKGEVLVVESTEPAVIMACQKASAILTNQGGMMSHAAIVSKELGIPCIVGLGNATDLINTGDLVEVDAEKGIVSIIK